MRKETGTPPDRIWFTAPELLDRLDTALSNVDRQIGSVLFVRLQLLLAPIVEVCLRLVDSEPLLGPLRDFRCKALRRLRGLEGICELYVGTAQRAHDQLERSLASVTGPRDQVQRGIIATDLAVARLRSGDCEARALAALNQFGEAHTALTRATDARDRAEPDELDSLGGCCFFSRPSQLYYAAEAISCLELAVRWLWLGCIKARSTAQPKHTTSPRSAPAQRIHGIVTSVEQVRTALSSFADPGHDVIELAGAIEGWTGERLTRTG